MKEIIARATTNVQRGRASTSNLVYESGKSRDDLIPGHTYQINGEYLQNDNYEYAEDIGSLEMLKCPTTTTISANEEVTVGENLTVTIIVKENLNNTNLSRGYITLYDGNEIVQRNYVITGNYTQITLNPSVTGTHELYAVYTDTGVEYNTSTSNHLNVTVNKLPSIMSVNLESINGTVGSVHQINGRLYSSKGNISNANVLGVDYNGSVVANLITDENGQFSFEYTLPSILANNRQLTIGYSGTNTIKGSGVKLNITAIKHDVNISVSDLEGYIDNLIDIVPTFVDENGDNIDSGNAVIELLKYTTKSLDMTSDGTVYNQQRRYNILKSSLTTSELQLIQNNVQSISDGTNTGFVTGSVISDNNLVLLVNSSYSTDVAHTWTLNADNYTFTFGYTPLLFDSATLNTYNVNTLRRVTKNGTTYSVFTLNNTGNIYPENSSLYWEDDSQSDIYPINVEEVQKTSNKIHFISTDEPYFGVNNNKLFLIIDSEDSFNELELDVVVG